MYYEEALILEICKKNDIFDIVSEYTELKWNKQMFTYLGACPFHKELSPSFTVNRKQQTFYCFACGAGGNVINFVMQIKKCKFSEAISELASRVGIFLPEKHCEKIEEKNKIKKAVFDINREAAKFYYGKLRAPEGKQGFEYFSRKRNLPNPIMTKFGLGWAGSFGQELYLHLKSKGFNDEEIMASELIGCNENYGGKNSSEKYFDKFWNRVMFPIMDAENKVIGFGGRVLDDSKPKYINSAETVVFDKSHTLYGLNMAKFTNRPYFICCEGYLDVIAMHKAGFTNAVASLGTALTKKHVETLANLTDTIYLAYDSDEPGIKAASRAIMLCKDAGITTKVINMAPAKDPDEFLKSFGAEAFEKRILEAEDGVHFYVKTLKEECEKTESGDFYSRVSELLLEKIVL